MIALDPIQSVRELRHIPVLPGVRPMPLSNDQIAVLRGILLSLESPRPMNEQLRREYVDALKRTIAELESGDAMSPVWWAAGAVVRSMRKVSKDLYITVDRPLQTWALDQLNILIPDEGQHDAH